jgi:hypothetical protein
LFARVIRSAPSPHTKTRLAAIWSWVQRGDIIESRFLIAGLLGHVRFAAATSLVRTFLWRAWQNGWIEQPVPQVTRTNLVAPSDAFQSLHGEEAIPFPHPSRAQHRALAIEAALTLAAANNTLWQTTSAFADDALNVRARQGKGMPVRGVTFPATPDIELSHAFGQRAATELLSTNYHDWELAEKWSDLPYTVAFVGTDRRVAERFLRVNRGAHCYHL